MAAADSSHLFNPFDWPGMQDPLTEAQIDHVQRLYEILAGVGGVRSAVYPVAIDQSQMGTGKTRCAQAVALWLGVPLFVVRPSTVDAWEVEAQHTGVEMVESITYERLASTPGIATPGHGWLTRQDGPATVFTATKQWKRRVRSGVLLVVDEAQNLKNRSDKSLAVQELIRVILQTWDDEAGPVTPLSSRALLLSGTLFDKEEHAMRMCEVLGLLSGEGHERDTSQMSIAARRRTQLAHASSPGSFNSQAEFQRYIFTDFANRVLTLISSSLPLPQLDVVMDTAIGFYQMDAEGAREMSRAIGELRTGEQRAVLDALMRAHRAKVGVTVRLVSQWLDSNPKAQAVVFGAFNDSLNSIVERLSRYRPQLLTGDTRQRSERIAMVERFQSGERRLLVANTQVGGVGLNMQDLHGDRPRHVFLLPTYSATDMLQAMYRCWRMGARSSVKVRLLFTLGAEEEERLLANLGRKTVVLQELMHDQVAQGKQFLEDFPHVEEREDGSEWRRPRGRQLQIPAPAARLRTFEDLLRHIAQSAVDTKLESLHRRFPGQGPLWAKYVISKRDVEHINELWQQLDEKSGNRMSEGWVTHYGYRDPGRHWGVIRWVDPECCPSEWHFEVTESGAVGELQKWGTG